MADAQVQIAPDSSGKKVRTVEAITFIPVLDVTTGGITGYTISTVETQVMHLATPDGLLVNPATADGQTALLRAVERLHHDLTDTGWGSMPW